MGPRERAEADIRAALAAETSAVRLSNRLFAPGGLFSRLFDTAAEKRAVVDSPLFAEAQQRVSDLQRDEAGRLATAAPPAVVSAAGPAVVPPTAPASADRPA